MAFKRLRAEYVACFAIRYKGADHEVTAALILVVLAGSLLDDDGGA